MKFRHCFALFVVPTLVLLSLTVHAQPLASGVYRGAQMQVMPEGWDSERCPGMVLLEYTMNLERLSSGHYVGSLLQNMMLVYAGPADCQPRGSRMAGAVSQAKAWEIDAQLDAQGHLKLSAHSGQCMRDLDFCDGGMNNFFRPGANDWSGTYHVEPGRVIDTVGSNDRSTHVVLLSSDDWNGHAARGREAGTAFLDALSSGNCAGLVSDMHSSSRSASSQWLSYCQGLVQNVGQIYSRDEIGAHVWALATDRSQFATYLMYRIDAEGGNGAAILSLADDGNQMRLDSFMVR